MNILHNKNECFAKFCEFKTFAKMQTMKKLKVFKTGGKYCSLKFQDILKVHGISHQIYTTYMSQQNGVVKHVNRTIMEVVQCMLQHQLALSTRCGQNLST